MVSVFSGAIASPCVVIHANTRVNAKSAALSSSSVVWHVISTATSSAKPTMLALGGWVNLINPS